MVKVVWRKGALVHLNKNFEHIKKDALTSARKVRDGILEAMGALSENPEMYPLDKYKKNNEGDIRAFEKFRIRVSYQVTDKEIRIIRVRHASRNPLPY
ncbi:MAG: type II toxin-antitoxin system RelE/ParE family toxin [Bacteroidota bacterium]